MELSDGREVVLANPLARICARAIDVISIIGLWYLAKLLFGFGLIDDVIENPESTDVAGFNIANIGFFFSILAVVAVQEGQSAGQSLMGVRLVSAQNGGTVSLLSRFARTQVLLLVYTVSHIVFSQGVIDIGVRWQLSWTILIIPVLPMFWSPSRQGWHDKSVGTIVVAERSEVRDWKDSFMQWCGNIRTGRLIPAGRSMIAFLLFLAMLTFGIAFWIDYFEKTDKQECYVTLHTIYEQASIEGIGAFNSPHEFVDSLILPTLENRDELLEVEHLELVSEGNGCHLDALKKYAKNWADSYQRELHERDSKLEMRILDELWSEFPGEQ